MKFICQIHLPQGAAAVFRDQFRSVALAADMGEQQQSGTFIDQIGQQLAAFNIAEMAADTEYPPFEFEPAV